ncbi:hypothetical protein [Clostridium luticellarii]|uniref:Sulfite exporter TauE/SafE n=1 Tax=Clostridium luticellarii TaxID=1691940 RepID=A0A2T0BEN5_9CLOT|nr:hypothetical protein [Clostridium luticellarii]PRR82293.1 hypothetical protein CLLU_29130 [Clostridium luticellarii]
MIIQIILTMFIVGMLLGFVGAGGSGFIISILTIIGAKFTKRVPEPVLKSAMVMVPVTAATILLL